MARPRTRNPLPAIDVEYLLQKEVSLDAKAVHDNAVIVPIVTDKYGLLDKEDIDKLDLITKCLKDNNAGWMRGNAHLSENDDGTHTLWVHVYNYLE